MVSHLGLESIFKAAPQDTAPGVGRFNTCRSDTLKSRGLGHRSCQSRAEGFGNAGNAGLGRGCESSWTGGGGQAGDPAGAHRKEENFKGSPQAHPRETLGEEDARKETGCQRPEERRSRGKVPCHGNQRGSESISRKRQWQGSGVEQEVGGPGPPVLLGRPCFDLSQLKMISVNFMRVRRRGGG